MSDIETQQDLQKLVGAFYSKAKEDEILRPIFHQFVKDWDSHILKVAGFWEATLFSEGSYKGNPMNIHQKVDRELNHSLEQAHFDRWVEIWIDTIDAMFGGNYAEMAKQRARNIANVMFIKIYQSRN